MRIAYLLANFPSITENFALREITAMRNSNINIDVLAARKDLCINEDYNFTIHYRPAIVSRASFFCILKTAAFRPLRFIRFLIFAVKLLFVSPSESLSLMANIHTACDFTFYIEKNNIKHLHAFFLSWPLLVAVGIKILSGIKISASAHSRDIYVEGGDVNRKIQEAEFVTVCTKTGLEAIKTRVSRSLHHKLLLSYHGMELDADNLCECKPNPYEIVAVGRLVPKKGYFVLLKAFVRILEYYPDARLKIIGNGKLYSQITRYIKKHQLAKSVLLMGWQNQEIVINTISRAGLLAVSSVKANDGDMDGIPNVILEAFSVMTPVVASDIESIREVIDHRVNGLLFETGNSEDLAKKIEDFYRMGDLRNKIVSAAKSTLARDFDIEKNIINKTKLLKQCNL